MQAEQAAEPIQARARIIALLAGLACFNQLDRQIMSVVLEPIRREFGASDTQLGILSGLVFALVYAAASVAAATWVINHSRRNILTAAAFVWGAMTALGGFAQSFAQLLIARAGIGLGEAGGVAPSHAIISDLYRPHERATAIAAWNAGNNIGIFFALLLGGYFAQRFGWRVTLIGAGLLTMAYAIVLRLSIREPPRRSDAGVLVPAGAPTKGSVGRTLRLIWQDRVLRHVAIGVGMTAIVAFGAVAWLPSFLIRVHGMSLAGVGLFLALVGGLGGAIGNYAGGRLSDYLRTRDVRWSLWLVAGTMLFAKPLIVLAYLVDSKWLALALIVPPGILAGVFYGPSIAVLHNRVPMELRAIGSALLLLMVNLIGFGLGPLLVGALSDLMAAETGTDSLRYALAITQALGVWGAVHFYFAGRALKAA